MDDDVPEGARGKLIARKQEWARDGRLLTGTTADPAAQRLPPGQTLASVLGAETYEKFATHARAVGLDPALVAG